MASLTLIGIYPRAETHWHGEDQLELSLSTPVCPSPPLAAWPGVEPVAGCLCLSWHVSGMSAGRPGDCLCRCDSEDSPGRASSSSQTGPESNK